MSTTEIPEEEGDEDVDTDDEDLAHYLEEKDSGSEDEAVEQLNPVEASVIKLKDKISLLKNRCEAGLGYDLTEKMYKIALKANRENQSSDRTWEILIEIVGKENIGFWAIMDNILFLEEKKREI